MRLLPALSLVFCATAHASELTDNAWGPVAIGMDGSDAMTRLDGYTSQDTDPACHYLYPTAQSGVYIMVIDGRVVRFDIYDAEANTVTARGIGIGSSKAEVIDAYPNTTISPHHYIAPEGEYLEVKLDNGNGLIFETDHDIVTSFRLGSYPAVGYIEGCL